MDRSLKLKLFGPKPDNDGYKVGGSARKQRPKRAGLGCIAANGDECSMIEV